jgi:hypothetical protein
MKSRNGRFGLLLAFVCFFLLASYGQDEKKQPEAYSGVAMGTGGSVGGKSTLFDFRIASYTTDEEVDNFAALLKGKGQDALRNALEKKKTEAGSIRWGASATRLRSPASDSRGRRPSSPS